MQNKRTGVDFSKHELLIETSELISIYELKKPNTKIHNIKYINTNGILADTGDFGNFIFCREFHPAKDEYVSDGYWEEKLQIHSCQNPKIFDVEGTIKEIDELLLDVDKDLTESEIEYLHDCRDNVEDGDYVYKYYSCFNSVGRFTDYENIPLCYDTNIQLKIIFDGFDEMCKRLSENNMCKSEEI